MITLTDSLQPLMQGLTDNAPARYKFLSYEIRTFTIPTQSSLINLPHLFNEKIPSRLLLAFYNQSAFIGDKTDTPYLTATDLKLRTIKIFHNGIVVREFRPSLGDNDHTEAFLTFAKYAKAENVPFCVDLDKFKKGNTFFAIDLLENCDSPQTMQASLVSGYMHIEAETVEPTKKPLIFLVIGESPASFDIDNCNHVRFARPVV